MTDLEQFNRIDEQIRKVAKQIKPIKYTNPLNADEKKELFLSGSIKYPVFEQEPFSDLYDIDKTEKNLDSIKVPDNQIGQQWYAKKIHTYMLLNDLLRNRRKNGCERNETTIRITSEIHGTPSKPLITYAEHLLKTLSKEIEPRTVKPEVIRKAIEDQAREEGLDLLVYNLDKLGLNKEEDLKFLQSYVDKINTIFLPDFRKQVEQEEREELNSVLDDYWIVGLSTKWGTTVTEINKDITVCGYKRMFTESDKIKQPAHELTGHMFRSANGYEQLFEVMATGTPGYLKTEEGISKYLEEKTGSLTPEVMRKCAAHVLATDSVLQGLAFRQTFDRLKDFEVDDEMAWHTSLRSHRGGGYIKEHVYLEGYLMIKEFVKTDGDFKSLYLGKIGIHDLPLVRSLDEKGMMAPPKYFPKVLEKSTD